LAQVTSLAGTTNWVWTVTFAYVQLLLARAAVAAAPRPWDPKARRDPQRALTPGQVRRAWAAFSHGLGTPAAAPRPCGKAPGRTPGFQPRPRTKFPIVAKASEALATCTAAVPNLTGQKAFSPPPLGVAQTPTGAKPREMWLDRCCGPGRNGLAGRPNGRRVPQLARPASCLNRKGASPLQLVFKSRPSNINVQRAFQSAKGT
jgi:hypothetical protein